MPSAQPASVRVTDGFICHSQVCSYGGQKQFCDLRCLSRLWCRARSRVWRTGKVLTLSRFCSKISFASIPCSQKNNSEFPALSFCTITAIMLSSQRFSTPMAPLDHTSAPLSDQTQVISETSFPSYHLRQPVCEGPVIALEAVFHNGSHRRNIGVTGTIPVIELIFVFFLLVHSNKRI